MIRRTTKLALEVVAFVLTGAAILVGLAAWRLSSDPVTIRFMTPLIESLMPGEMRLAIGDTAIRWEGFERPLRLGAQDVTIYEDGQRPAAVIPGFSMSLSATALLNGEFVPRRLEFVGPRLHLVRTEDGRLSVELGGAPGGQGADALDRVLRALQSTPGDETATSELDELTIVDAEILFEDRRQGLTWHVPEADLTLKRFADAIRGSMQVTAPLGVDGLTTLSVEFVHWQGDGTSHFLVQFDDLSPEKLARLDPRLARLAQLETRLDGSAQIRTDSRLQVRSVDFTLTGGAGRAHLDGLFPRPLSFAGLSLAGAADLTRTVLRVDQLRVELGGPSLILAGEASVGPNGIAVEGDAAIQGLPVDLLATYWPPGAAEGARAWITSQLSEGMVRRAHAHVRARLPARDGRGAPARLLDLGGGIDFDGVTVAYLDGMPPATDVAGTARFDRQGFVVDIAAGRLRDVSVPEGTAVIAGLDRGPSTIDIDLAVTGPVRTVLEVLNSPRLGYADKMGVAPADSGGRMSGRLRFVFPLIRRLRTADLRIAAAANLRDAWLRRLFADENVADLDGTLRLDGQMLAMTGTASLNAIPLRFELSQPLGGTHDYATRVALTGVATETDLAELGLPDTPRLAGSLPFTATYVDHDRERQTLSAAFDLAGTTVAVEALDWTKPAGVPGKGSLTLEMRDHAIERISAFSVESPVGSAMGSVDIADVDLEELNLDTVFYDGNSLSAKVTPQPSGGYGVTVRGPVLDLGEWLEADSGGGDAEPLSIDFDIGKLVLGEGRVLNDAVGSVERDGEGWTAAAISARTEAGDPIELRFGPSAGGGDHLYLTAANIGRVARSLGIVGGIEGGQLVLAGRHRDGRTSGTLDIRDFRVADAPVLAAVLAAAPSISGLQDLLANQGLTFDRLTAEVDRAGDVLVLRQGRAVGGALGITFDGRIDLGRDTVDVGGTIVPAYTVNQAIGAIPVLGTLLTGGDGKGVFALTYRVRGSLADPAVTVNPLSALAPGFLRTLFFEGGGAADQPPPSTVAQRSGD